MSKERVESRTNWRGILRGVPTSGLEPVFDKSGDSGFDDPPVEGERQIPAAPAFRPFSSRLHPPW